MSHWLVDDAASTQLMDYLYSYLAEGFPKDEALRQAKLKYLQTASVQRANPTYWGNFVLVGKATSIAYPIAQVTLLVYIVSGIVLLLVVWSLWRRQCHLNNSLQDDFYSRSMR